eukprot:5300828-Pyramimonas_sp.AAC.1
MAATLLRLKTFLATHSRLKATEHSSAATVVTTPALVRNSTYQPNKVHETSYIYEAAYLFGASVVDGHG